MLSFRLTPFAKILCVSSLFLASLDWLTKFLATTYLIEHNTTLVGPFSLYLIYHPWYLDALQQPHANPWLNALVYPLLVFIGLVLLAAFINKFVELSPDHDIRFYRLTSLGMGCSCSGLLGNSLAHLAWDKGVPDFLVYGDYPFIFNFADVFLLAGIICCFSASLWSLLPAFSKNPASEAPILIDPASHSAS